MHQKAVHRVAEQQEGGWRMVLGSKVQVQASVVAQQRLRATLLCKRHPPKPSLSRGQHRARLRPIFALLRRLLRACTVRPSVSTAFLQSILLYYLSKFCFLCMNTKERIAAFIHKA